MRYKAKNPRSISYAVGSEILSEALIGIPQYDELILDFRSMLYSGTWQRTSSWDINQPMIVLIAEYHANQIERWILTVYGIPATHKSAARNILLESGLLEIRDWFTRERPPLWFDARKEPTV